MKSLTLAVCCVCLLARAAAAQDGDDSKVLSADSAWRANDKPLLRGVPVRKGAALVADAAGELLLDCGLPKPLLYSCGTGISCHATACSDKEVTGATVRPLELSLLAWVWESLMTREPKQLVMAAARSGGNPNDAVVALDERGVHWGPALMRVLEGRYCLQLSQLPTGTSGGDATALLDWDRAVDAEGVASTPGVSPGLHALQKGSPGSNGSCEFDADGTTAWVLVVPAPEFQRLDAAWKQQAVSIADLERGGISLATATTVRHAVLADLAATVAAP